MSTLKRIAERPKTFVISVLFVLILASAGGGIYLYSLFAPMKEITSLSYRLMNGLSRRDESEVRAIVFCDECANRIMKRWDGIETQLGKLTSWKFRQARLVMGNLRPARAHGQGRENEAEYEATFGGTLRKTMVVVVSCSNSR